MFRSICAAAAVVAASFAGAHATGRPALHVKWPPSSPTLRQETPFTVSGTVTGAPRGARIVLQYRSGATTPGKPAPAWKQAAAVAPTGRAFKLTWTPPKSFPDYSADLRLALMASRRVLAATKVWPTLVGQPIVNCTPPPGVSATTLPSGDGEIVGGAYIMGGPAPGIDACASDQYTVTATDATSGTVAGTQSVAGGHEYALVLPAGSYQLAANGCKTYNPVSVTAGQITHADVDCDVP